LDTTVDEVRMMDAENGPMNKLQVGIPNISMEFRIKHYAEKILVKNCFIFNQLFLIILMM